MLDLVLNCSFLLLKFTFYKIGLPQISNIALLFASGVDGAFCGISETQNKLSDLCYSMNNYRMRLIRIPSDKTAC